MQFAASIGRIAPILVVALLASPVLAEGTVSISRAWTPMAAVGVDTPLFMTINNDGPGDSLLRAKCTTANFSEEHTIDTGEGSPSMRTIKAIPIAANRVTQLSPDGFHVMLLQTTQPLTADVKFHCSLTFRDAGKQDVEVTVGQPK